MPPHALVLRAREALARGDVRSAEAAVDERLKTAGRDINALGVRSFLLQRRGQFGEAARTLQTVIGSTPAPIGLITSSSRFYWLIVVWPTPSRSRVPVSAPIRTTPAATTHSACSSPR